MATGWEKRSATAAVRVEIQGQELRNLAGGACNWAAVTKGGTTASPDGTVEGEGKEGGKKRRKKEREERRVN